MKSLIMALLSITITQTYAQEGTRSHISCNDGEVQIDRVCERAEGEVLYCYANLIYKGTLVASELQSDAIDIKEVDPNASFSIFESKDSTTFIQVANNGSGQAYVKLPGEFYRRIIPITNCDYIN